MSKIYKDLKTAIIVVVLLSIAILILHFFLYGTLRWDTYKGNLFYNAYYGIPLSLFNGWFFDSLNKIFPWEKHPSKRAIIGIIGSIVVTMLSLAALNFILWTLIEGNEIGAIWLKENRAFYIIALVITIIITAILHAIGFFQEAQREKVMNARLRQEKLATELSALRAHVDPHFLFNSFNVLSGLIDEDKEKAQDFLAGLSRIYRYILEQRNEDTSTVRDELKFAEQYLNLQKMRFEDSINLDTQISPALLHKKIPSLTLQLLLENALKHNSFDEDEPLDISITEQEGSLLVRNNKKERKNISLGNGLGLQNIRDRYALLTTEALVIQDTEHFFTVKLPLI
jgi:two-component system LytT family sensor kinase